MQNTLLQKQWVAKDERTLRGWHGQRLSLNRKDDKDDFLRRNHLFDLATFIGFFIINYSTINCDLIIKGHIIIINRT